MLYSVDWEKINKRREEQHITIEELCSMARMSKTVYYRKKRGKSEFTRQQMIDIANALNFKSPGSIFFAEEVS